MALSFIVTGTAWKWILNPTMGIEKFVHQLGFEKFQFDWLVTPGMSIYTIVIAGVWQSSGFIMAIFLAGLRSIDDEVIKAAKVDGASTLFNLSQNCFTNDATSIYECYCYFSSFIN